MHPRWSLFDTSDRRAIYIVITASLVGFALAGVCQDAWNFWARSENSEQKIYRSPRESVRPSVLDQAGQEHPYPPDALPGARDVDTPYGGIRVYEWGPADGRKVLFVHGISTPCIVLGKLAQCLVDKGCRVMLFDLFGRGYSDTPDPGTYPQNTGLFTTQILLVLASSPLSWTGQSERFTLVGYSLGGGIATTFASYMPQLIKTLVVIAPAGLMRPARFAQSGRWLYHGSLPEWIVENLVRKRLTGSSGNEGSGEQEQADDVSGSSNIEHAARAELPSEEMPHQADSAQPVTVGRREFSIARAVAWQIETHPGFVKAFISSIRHAPIADQEARWGAIAQRQEQAREEARSNEARRPLSATSLQEGKMLMLLGVKDTVIDMDETSTDAMRIMGEANLAVVAIDGDHSIPVSCATQCANAMFEFWQDSVPSETSQRQYGR